VDLNDGVDGLIKQIPLSQPGLAEYTKPSKELATVHG
jgi:hypothetical protein